MQYAKRILSVLLVIALAGCLFACKKVDPDDNPTTTTDPVSTSDADTTTGEEPGTSPSEGSTGAGETTTKKNSVDTSKLEELGSLLGSAGLKEDPTDPFVKDKNENTSTISKDPLPTGSTGGVTQNSKLLANSTVYKYINSGTYTLKGSMTANIDGTTMAVPITVAASGKKLYVQMSMDLASISDAPAVSGSVSMAMMHDGSKYYMLLPTYRMFAEISAEDFSSQSSSSAFDMSNLTYKSTAKVTYSGKEYLCETYTRGSSTYRFFFQGSDLKRIEVQEGSTVTMVDIQSITNTANSSLFKIPIAYVDLNKLGGLDLGSLLQ